MAYGPMGAYDLQRMKAQVKAQARGRPIGRRPISPALRPQLGDVLSTVTSTASGAVTNPVGTAIGVLTGALKSVFGTGDTSPFQDKMIANLANLAAQGKVWAFQWLMGESGRWGAVNVDGGRSSNLATFQANLPNVGAQAGDDTQKWAVGGAGNWGGGAATDSMAGPTVRVGSQDNAYVALQKISQAYGITLPPPNQYQTNSPGRVTNTGNPTVFRPTFPANLTGNASTQSTLYGGIPGIPTIPGQPGVPAAALPMATSGIPTWAIVGLGGAAVVLLLKKGRR